MAGMGVWYGRLVRGDITGAGACCLRLLLAVVAWFYKLVIVARNWLYDAGWLRCSQLDVPVICIGNITAGGTGKTPMVVWLCRYLQSKGLKPAVLSRGYKASRQGGGSDEVQLLQAILQGVAIVTDSDRLRGGKLAISRYGADVLVMDDGFQHRRLKRDLDIVMLDSTQPFGLGKMLPRGFLREPVTGIRRAGVVLLSRSEMLDETQHAELKRKVRNVAGNVAGRAKSESDLLVLCSYISVTGLLSASGQNIPPEQLRGKKVAVFCGIGNPQAFVATLGRAGAEVVAENIYDDHFVYDNASCNHIARTARQSGAEMVITTEKDWVKLKQIDTAKHIPHLYRLQIETEIGQGKGELCRIIDVVTKGN